MGKLYSNYKNYLRTEPWKNLTDYAETKPWKELTDYISNDILTCQKMHNAGLLECPTDIKKVIFNGNATIVIWLDGSKTIVKCAEGDGYSKFSGLAIAICKHIYGPNFKKVFNRFIPKEETECHSSETTNSKQ